MLLLLQASGGGGGGGGTAPSIVAGWTKATGIPSGTSITVTLPVNIAGDVIYVVAVQDALATHAISGWTVLMTTSLTGFGGETFTVLYKTSSGSEPATVSLTSTANERWA